LNLRYVIGLFWYIVWFVAIPATMAWQLVEIMVRSFGFLEEFEFWHVLLLYAVLVYITYSFRDKLPFWKTPDELNPFKRRRRYKEARRLMASVTKILQKKGAEVSKKGKAELEAAVQSLQESLDQKSDASIVQRVASLAEKADQHLAFAKKGAIREYMETIGVAVLVAVVLRLFVVEAFKIPSESMVPTLMVGDHIFVSKYRYGLSLPFIHTRIIRFASPKHGEVVVFIKPPSSGSAAERFLGDEADMTGTDFIKRIVGLPGDRVEMRENVLFINDRRIPRCRVGTSHFKTRDHFSDTWRDGEADLWIERHGEFEYTIIQSPGAPPDSFPPVIIPDDRVFVLGDNRDNSNDSRYWGTVPFDNIKGRAMFIWWSNKRPHGFQWDRVGTFIMGDPKLTDAQKEALARCPDMR
jgi:signal peptidase I